jgi:hypothetical protein
LENKITGRETQGACRQDELIGGNFDSLALTLALTLTLGEELRESLEATVEDDEENTTHSVI